MDGLVEVAGSDQIERLRRADGAELGHGDPDRVVELVVQPGLVASGDPHLLRAVLENLIGNAWKFTGRQARGRELGMEEGGDGQVVFYVADDGAGFAPEAAARLFPFERLHTRDELPGTGLGLATVQRIIVRRGGRIWAEAAPGAGARFSFTLPPAPLPAAPAGVAGAVTRRGSADLA